jgi:uncharacterized protein DUF4823
VALLLVTVACASTQTTGGIVAGQAPVRKGKVLIIPVTDGKERSGEVAAGSGIRLASAISRRPCSAWHCASVSDSASIAEAVREARELGYDYILKAAITEWEDNATEWSGRPDSAALSVELYDLTPTLVSSGSHRKKASALAIASSSPDRFVPELIQFTLARVFGPR